MSSNLLTAPIIKNIHLERSCRKSTKTQTCNFNKIIPHHLQFSQNSKEIRPIHPHSQLTNDSCHSWEGQFLITHKDKSWLWINIVTLTKLKVEVTKGGGGFRVHWFAPVLTEIHAGDRNPRLDQLVPNFTKINDDVHYQCVAKLIHVATL